MEAVADARSQLRIYWDAPVSDNGDAITTYRIEWDTAATYDSQGGFPTGTEDLAATTTSQSGKYFDASANSWVYVFPSESADALTPGTQYYVRMVAANDQGFGFYGDASPRCEATS